MAQLQPYEQYQPIDYDYVKQLPVDWRLLPNIAIFQERIERGHNNEELLSVTIGKGVIKQSDLDKKDSSTLDKSKYLLVYPDDLVYSMRFRQGASGYSNYKGIVSPACTVLKPRKGVTLNSRYYHYMIRTGFYKNYAERYAYGIADGQMPLRYSDFKRMYSIVPLLDTQNRIVEYLDKKNNEIDRFIRNKERLIELLEESKKNAIDVAFTRGVKAGIELKETDFEWLSNIPNHWNLKRLKFLSKIISKGSTPSTEGREMTSSGIRFVKAENIFKSKIISEPAFFIDPITHRVLKRSQLKENDLLFVIAGATIGKVAIVTTEHLPANTNQAVSFIRLKNKVDVEFCYYWLHSKFITTNIWLNAVTSAQPNLAMEDLGNLIIPYPPNDEEKVEIVQHIKYEHSIIDMAISKAQQEITSIKEYREALITDLVTGKRGLPPSIPK